MIGEIKMANRKFISMLLGLADKRALQRISALLALVMTIEAGAVPLAQATVMAQAMPVRSHVGAELPSAPTGIQKQANTAAAPFRVPALIGSTVETFAPVSAGRLVYHVQDVHGHLGAQTNLSEIITRLASYAENQGKQLVVAVEGGAGKIETDSLASFPDANVKRQVSSALLRSGFLMGEEYSAIVNKPGLVQIVGIETPELYNANVIARENSVESRERILGTVREIKSQLVRLESHNFNTALLTLEKNRVAVEEGRMEMAEYIAFLVRTDKGLVAKYPMVARLAALHDSEKVTDFPAVEKEGRSLVEALVRQKNDKEVEKIMNDAIALREGRMSALSYYEMLLSRSDKSYPALKSYVAYLRDAEKVDADVLFIELQALENDMAKKLVRHPLAYELYKDVRWIERQERFFSLNMVPHEWQSQKGLDVAEIYRMHGEIRAFVAEQVNALGYRFATPSFSMSDLQIAVGGATGFYKAAEARDSSMEGALRRVLDKHQKDGAIVAFVAGGFHTPGMTRALRAHGIAYQIIRPQLEAGFELNKDLNYPAYKAGAGLLPNHATTDFLRATSNLPRNAGLVADQMNHPTQTPVLASAGVKAPRFTTAAIAAAWRAVGLGNRKSFTTNMNVDPRVAIPILVALVVTVVVGIVLVARYVIRKFGNNAVTKTIQDLRHDSGITIGINDQGLDLLAMGEKDKPEGDGVVLVRGGSGSNGGGSGAGGRYNASNVFDGVNPERLEGPLKLLKANVDAGVVTNPKHFDVIRELIDLNQDKLFAGWEAPGKNDDKKIEMLVQAVSLDAYYPGGLKTYRSRLIDLIAKGLAKFNPIAGKILKRVPAVELKGPADPTFQRLENTGLKAANRTVYAMPFGGKGERLGLVNGIKPAVPMDLATMRPYMTEFLGSIDAFQRKSNELNGENIPAAVMIMASPDNRDLMVDLLSDSKVSQGYEIVEKTGDHYDVSTTLVPGNGKGTIYILSQGKVPASNNLQGDFVLDATNPYAIASSPHGHGDVHTLIKLSNLDEQWEREGRQHVVFIQDTNSVMRQTVMAGLGASVEKNIGLNFMTFVREAGENYGLIVEVQEQDGTPIRRRNVEYTNAKDILPGGDVADPATGHSPFDGNLNQYIVKLPQYRAALSHTGESPEILALSKLQKGENGRLEYNSQDIALIFAPSDVGTTLVEPREFVFAPAKNAPEAAAKLAANGTPAEGMQTSEALYYKAIRLMLSAIKGVTINVAGQLVAFRGVSIPVGAIVSFDAAFAPSIDELAKKVTGQITISDRSALTLQGAGIKINGLKLDGALEVSAAHGVEVTIENLDVTNAGWKFVELTAAEINDQNVPEYLRIRGYRLEKTETASFNITEPGKYVIDQTGLHRVGDVEVAQPFHWGASLAVGLGIIVVGALGGYYYNAYFGFVAILGALFVYLAHLGKIVANTSTTIEDNTDLQGLLSDDKFSKSAINAVLDFKAGLSSPTREIKVVLTPGKLESVNKEKGILYIGVGLLEASSGLEAIGRALLLRAVLTHARIHFTPLQIPTRSHGLAFIANEAIAWILGSMLLPFDLAYRFISGFVFQYSGSGDQNTFAGKGMDVLGAAMGAKVSAFFDAAKAVGERLKAKLRPAVTPINILWKVDSIEGFDDKSAGAIDEKAFVDLLFKFHLPGTELGALSGEVVLETKSQNATYIATLTSIINQANDRARVAGRNLKFNLLQTGDAAIDVTAAFSAGREVNPGNTVIMGGLDAKATVTGNLPFESVTGPAQLAVATFAYASYSNGKGAYGEIYNLLNKFMPEIINAKTLTNDIATQLLAALQA